MTINRHLPYLAAVLALLLPGGVSYAEGPGDLEVEEQVFLEEQHIDDIPVDERIYLEPWNSVPFDKRFFTYTDEQIEQQWDQLTRSLKIPYPSAAFLQRQFERYPWLADEIEGFEGDYADLHKRFLEVGRLFLSGDFQQARNLGMKLGVVGKGLAMLSQTIYAIYLEDRQSRKQMLLQDVLNIARDYLPRLREMEGDPEVTPYALLIKLGYTYALARIAEEAPMPVAIARNYGPRIKSNAEDILEQMPGHGLALAFRGGVDAGIMRRVGKLTGRMAYGARTTVVNHSFESAEEAVSDMAIILYEHANALIYMNRLRQLDEAIEKFQQAANIAPLFAMEALDSMYAYKRIREIQLYASEYRSFRKFDRARRRFIRVTDLNLTSVLMPALTHEQLSNPRDYSHGSQTSQVSQAQ